ncbi:MAG: 50S ribosomal protein L17 [Clostridiales bacterium]|nr:50S ribosomal protein L17 [Clostridiales bacterium]MDR2711747.1 50S ribosomal protein L17 [Clostridiales bacterium]
MAYRRLGVKSAHRRAMMRNAATSLFKHGKITTTEPRAKELASIAEKMITVAKQGDLAARRRALAFLLEEDVVTKLFEDISGQYKERQGGYTRIVRLQQRRGDGAQMVLLELV